MNLFHISVNGFSRNLTSFFDDRLSSFGLATSYVELLIQLMDNEPSTQTEIAGGLDLAPSTVTRFIDKLISEGYVNRKRAGRSVSIELTETGRKKTSEMKKVYDDTVMELNEMMGGKYLDTVRKLLEFGNEEINKNR